MSVSMSTVVRSSGRRWLQKCDAKGGATTTFGGVMVNGWNWVSLVQVFVHESDAAVTLRSVRC